MKKLTKFAVLMLSALVFLFSCESTDNVEKSGDKQKKEKTPKVKKGKFDYELYNTSYEHRDFQTCINLLSQKNSKKTEIKDKLDMNMLQHFMGDYEGSGRSFFETQGLMQQSAADMTAGKVMGAALSSEDSVTYSGAVYERLLAYSMRIVNSIASGKMDEALGVVYTYTGDYKDIIAPLVQQQKEIAASSEGVLEDSKVSGAMDVLTKFGDVNLSELSKGIPQKTDVTYETSPFLSYLGTLVYAANNDPDHAKDFGAVLKTDIPSLDVTEDIEVPAGKGRLNVLALSGTIGKRADSNLEKILMFTIDRAGYSLPVFFKFSYPVFRPEDQNHAIKSVRVKLSNGDTKDAIVIENFDNAVAIDVASKARGAFNRSIFRNITKAAAVIPTNIVALEAAQKGLEAASANPIASIAAQVAVTAAVEGMKAALAAFADAEEADIRQCDYFPNFASSAGFTVDPGTYNVTVEYLDGETVIESRVIENVVVEEGKVAVKVSTCEK